MVYSYILGSIILAHPLLYILLYIYYYTSININRIVGEVSFALVILNIFWYFKRSSINFTLITVIEDLKTVLIDSLYYIYYFYH